MDVVSLSPLRVGSVVWQPRPSSWVFTVVCKATFSLRPNESPLAPEQEGLNENDVHWGNEPDQSLYAPADLVPLKPLSDIVLTGHAFAPGKVPVRSIAVRMAVGSIDKSIEVFCDRIFNYEGKLQESTPFLRMPLVYERAAGGPGTSNPAGLRADVRNAYGNIAVPNLQPPGVVVTSPSDASEPVGFGAIAATWPLRREKLGPLAAGWSPREWRTRPLPEGFNPAYFNLAPRDQQVSALHENERIVLENLHPEHPRLLTSLPGIRPKAMIEGRPGGPHAIAMRADTLWIDTDRSLCTLTWRAQIALEHPDERGRVSISMEESLAGTDKLSGPYTPPPRKNTKLPSDEEIAAGSRPLANALPFAPASQPGSSSPSTAGKVASALPFRPPDSASGPNAVLPFAAAPAAAAPRPSGEAPSVWASTPSPGSVVPAPRPSDAGAPARSKPPAPSSPWSAGADWNDTAPDPISAGAPAASPVESSDNPATSGVLGASNAAAARAPWSIPRTVPPDAPASASLDIRSDTRPSPRDILHLIGYHPDAAARVRRQAAWSKILDDLSDQPLDSELDDPAFGKEPADVEDRRDVFEILARGEWVDATGMDEALSKAVREDGKFVPPLVLAGGELRFSFDEVETLKAAVAVATPFMTALDEALKAGLSDAREFLAVAGGMSAPEVADGLTGRIREAFNRGKRSLPDGYLDAQVKRALLEKRHYHRRQVFGDLHVRALLAVPGSHALIPAYLPDTLSASLPMYDRFKARLIGEVRFQEDQYESHPTCLKALALARAIQPDVRAKR